MGTARENFQVRDCSFINITTTMNGGVMYLENIGNMTIENSIFRENSAVDGGVFYYEEENSKYLLFFMFLMILRQFSIIFK